MFYHFYRLYEFLNVHNCIYELQFDFIKNHSTNYALLSLTENIREALDGNNFACGIFIDLQKALDTVDHDLLLQVKAPQNTAKIYIVHILFLMQLICHTDVLLSSLTSYKPFPGSVNITLRKVIKKYLGAAEYQ